MIYPCLCDGTIKYVHKTCIDQWRSISAYPNAFWECPTCKFKYVLTTSNVSPWKLRMTYYFLFMFEMLKALAIFIGTVLAVAMFNFICDKDYFMYKGITGSTTSPHLASSKLVLVYCLLALIELTIAIGLIVFLRYGGDSPIITCILIDSSCTEMIATFLLIGLIIGVPMGCFLGVAFMIDKFRSVREKTLNITETQRYQIQNRDFSLNRTESTYTIGEWRLFSLCRPHREYRYELAV